ncbi:hypothetical protein X743_29785 [Mesorhizobium sp. LNHC252B00]|nr:hypothetical protein X743_29785 [Mesorhizobium sp. LNHC252B00]
MLGPWLNDPTSHKIQNLISRRVRRWKKYLSPVDYIVIDEIIDQTAGAGRTNGNGTGRLEWGFSYTSLEHGDRLAGGTGFSKATLRRSLDSLKKMDLIRVDNGPDGNRLKITPNLNWRPASGAILASEKRKEAAAKKQRGVVDFTPGEENHTTPALGRASLLLTDEHPPLPTEEHVPCSRMSTIRDGSSEPEDKEPEAGLSSPAGNDASASPSTSLRQRVLQVAKGASGEKDASGERKTPPVPATPLSEIRVRQRPSPIVSAASPRNHAGSNPSGRVPAGSACRGT